MSPRPVGEVQFLLSASIALFVGSCSMRLSDLQPSLLTVTEVAKNGNSDQGVYGCRTVAGAFLGWTARHVRLHSTSRRLLTRNTWRESWRFFTANLRTEQPVARHANPSTPDRSVRFMAPPFAKAQNVAKNCNALRCIFGWGFPP
jgi:hypothetical protein